MNATQHPATVLVQAMPDDALFAALATDDPAVLAVVTAELEARTAPATPQQQMHVRCVHGLPAYEGCWAGRNDPHHFDPRPVR